MKGGVLKRHLERKISNMVFTVKLIALSLTMSSWQLLSSYFVFIVILVTIFKRTSKEFFKDYKMHYRDLNPSSAQLSAKYNKR